MVSARTARHRARTRMFGGMGFSNSYAFRTCPWCGVQYAQMQVHSTNLEAKVPGRAARHWAFMTCPACGGGVMVEHNSPSVSPPIELLASPESNDVLSSVEHLPPDVAEYFDGAIRVLRAGVPAASAVQLRRTLEAAAAHHGFSTGTLVKRIKSMIEAGLVTASFGDVLHHVRTIGNQGAHATDEQLSEDQVQQALKFTIQLLRNVFEVPAELAALTQDQEVTDDGASPTQG